MDAENKMKIKIIILWLFCMLLFLTNCGSKINANYEYIDSLAHKRDRESYVKLCKIYSESSDVLYEGDIRKITDYAGVALRKRHQDEFISDFINYFNYTDLVDARVTGFLILQESDSIETLKFCMKMYFDLIDFYIKENQYGDSQGCFWVIRTISMLAKKYNFSFEVDDCYNFEDFFSAKEAVQKLQSEINNKSELK